MKSSTLIKSLVLIISLIAPLANAERIKDIAEIEGVRSNPLVGYGLVVGLDGINFEDLLRVS